MKQLATGPAKGFQRAKGKVFFIACQGKMHYLKKREFRMLFTALRPDFGGIHLSTVQLRIAVCACGKPHSKLPRHFLDSRTVRIPGPGRTLPTFVCCASTINVKRTTCSRVFHALSSSFSRSEYAFPRSWWLFHANSRQFTLNNF